MFRNKSVDVHQFAMVPRADIPRSSFRIQTTHKTTFDAGYLIPVYVDEILPGDSFNLKMTAFARMSTPIFPIMDNLYLESFFFFVPNRLTWRDWIYFMGEQNNPGDSTDFTVPQCVSPAGGFAFGSIFDYMGLPTTGQITGSNTISVNALPLTAYNLIYNQWFRDENLCNSRPINTSDTPRPYTDYILVKRGKRPDYFTSCLPFAQKGDAVTLPLGTSAPVKPLTAASSPFFKEANQAGTSLQLVTTAGSPNAAYSNSGAVNNELLVWSTASGGPGLYADLSAATAATINQMRLSFQIQKLLERDARGGTRYTEIIRAHFGVTSPDARLQRPEYLGGGKTPVSISPIAQTSATALDGSDTPLGNLAAIGTAVAHNHGFSAAFTEHGFVIGLVCVYADLTYQQGIRRMWSRTTRYDYYFPVFAALGEQAVLNKEIYATGGPDDALVFGYQSRWDEYRYNPSLVTSQFNSTYTTPLDAWHLAQFFGSLPVLNQSFIEENPPMDRILAADTDANGQQFIFDSFFDIKAARPMPMYSVPGLIDHF